MRQFGLDFLNCQGPKQSLLGNREYIFYLIRLLTSDVF